VLILFDRRLLKIKWRQKIPWLSGSSGIKQQLQFGLFKEFAFYGNDLANADEPAL
jgi:hypothetical protein